MKSACLSLVLGAWSLVAVESLPIRPLQPTCSTSPCRRLKERKVVKKAPVSTAEFERLMLRGLKGRELRPPEPEDNSPCLDCDTCFTCDGYTTAQDGSITATIKHCKEGTISWMCCVGINGNTDGVDCDTSCGSSKCETLGTDQFTVTVPYGTAYFEVNMHDGKIEGDADRVSPVCGGKAGANSNQGGSCGGKDLASTGKPTAHCLKRFDLEEDCGYRPPPPVCDDQDCIVRQNGLCDENNEFCVGPRECFCVDEANPPDYYPIFLANSLVGGNYNSFPECMCEGCGVCDPIMKGDPHLRNWAGEWFDYMGECDMKLLTVPRFDGKHDMDIDVRTTIRDWYSYIEAAAVRIGDETLELDSFGTFTLNGVEGAAAPDEHVWHAPKGEILTISGYPIYYYRVDKKHTQLDVVLSPQHNITLKSFKTWVSVDVQVAGSDFNFDRVTGLMGTIDGQMLTRNGTDMSANINALAEDWQVQAYEGSLFRAPREPQAPAKCKLPKMPAPESYLEAVL